MTCATTGTGQTPARRRSTRQRPSCCCPAASPRPTRPERTRAWWVSGRGRRPRSGWRAGGAQAVLDAFRTARRPLTHNRARHGVPRRPAGRCGSRPWPRVVVARSAARRSPPARCCRRTSVPRRPRPLTEHDRAAAGRAALAGRRPGPERRRAPRQAGAPSAQARGRCRAYFSAPGTRPMRQRSGTLPPSPVVPTGSPPTAAVWFPAPARHSSRGRRRGTGATARRPVPRHERAATPDRPPAPAVAGNGRGPGCEPGTGEVDSCGRSRSPGKAGDPEQ